MTGTEFLSAFEKIKTAYKPDILTCLANLSNDEVFTPPSLANDILDLLPQELFESKDTKFLDPACKSGVFLREIARRLMKGLEKVIPDDEERRNHILTKQVYGIAITSLTALMSRRSLYCSQNANGKYSVCTAFKGEKGNISFKPIPHTFKKGNCLYCGASEKEYGEKVRASLESHAYEFIHLSDKQSKELKEMKFDVIIGNPPYQLETGGFGRQAKPIYHLFVQQAKKLNPRFLTMIIPSRCFSGGMGLDSFRDEMLNDRHLISIVDYPNAKDCFPQNSISGGVSYFLRSRDNADDCNISSIRNGITHTLLRKLDEFPVFVRYNEAVEIIRKIRVKKENTLVNIASSLTPFGLPTNHRGQSEKSIKNAVVLHSSAGVSYVSSEDITKGFDYLNKYKVLISKTGAEHAGEPDKEGKYRVLTSSIKVLIPQEACTHSYFVIGPFDNKNYAENLLSYLKTKFLRFLVLQSMSSINVSKSVFQLVPMQDFSESWSDEKLYKKYDLSQDEIDFIESMIKPMDLNEKEEQIEDGADDE